ncbi:WD repeat-containing protein 78 [Phlyctochytrium planicorne]|nr:WD repeat-containing protein 78 [Phlyctochytrium planicorne]
MAPSSILEGPGTKSRSTLPRGGLGNASTTRVGGAHASMIYSMAGASGPGGKSHSMMGPGSKSMQGAMLGMASSAAVGQVPGGPMSGVQVMDEEGNDVTPVSLVPHVKGVPNFHGGKMGASATEVSIASVTKETVADVLNNLESMTNGSWNAGAFGRSGISFSNSSRNSIASSDDEKDNDSNYDSANDSDEKEEATSNHRTSTAHSGKATADTERQLANSKTFSETELNQLRDVYLSETETIWLLDLPSIAVSNDFTEEVATVRERNAKYNELLGSRANNENFTERGMQTFNFFLKNKEVQVDGPTYASVDCQVTRWGIHDTYAERKNETNEAGTDSKEADTEGENLNPDAPPSQASQPEPNSLQSSGPAESIMLPTTELASGSIAASRSVFHLNDDNVSEANFSVVHVNAVGTGNATGSTATVGHGVGGETTMMHMDFGLFADKDVVNINMLPQDALRTSLLVMERAVMGNNYDKKYLLYRNIDEEAEAAARLRHLNDVANEAKELVEESHRVQNEEGEEGDEGNGEGIDGEENEGEREAVDEADAEDAKKNDSLSSGIPTLNALWSYRCELTRGRMVMYMAWNKQNEDILAVAYGESKTNVSPFLGLVLCWSPKNPEWPDRIYRSSSAVTAIDFSRSNPNLLAVGYMDGRIAVYDVRRKGDRPVLDSSDHAGKHRDPVWELKWVDRERVIGDDQSRGETLVSVSTDGRVCQWLIRKGIEHTDLMTLKRVTRQQDIKPGAPAAGAAPGNASGSGGGHTSGSKTSAFIARQAGGLCFDFNPNDSNIYIVGTEDGYIHRCSCSYNEQYLATQFGHTGAVYKVKWSPFLPGYYLSCSADWTVRLWGVDDEEAIFKFQSGKDAITDVAWSVNNSTVFGCVSNDGRMEIWDLQFSVLDPAILHTVLDRRLTAIIFATRSPTVLIGDDNGTVSVFNLKGGSVARMASPNHSNEKNSGLFSKSVMEEQANALLRVISNKNQTANAGNQSGQGAQGNAAAVAASSQE